MKALSRRKFFSTRRVTDWGTKDVLYFLTLKLAVLITGGAANIDTTNDKIHRATRHRPMEGEEE